MAAVALVALSSCAPAPEPSDPGLTADTILIGVEGHTDSFAPDEENA